MNDQYLLTLVTIRSLQRIEYAKISVACPNPLIFFFLLFISVFSFSSLPLHPLLLLRLGLDCPQIAAGYLPIVICQLNALCVFLWCSNDTIFMFHQFDHNTHTQLLSNRKINWNKNHCLKLYTRASCDYTIMIIKSKSNMSITNGS